MEVHHHSHTADPDMHRGRKKWTHYFWEFLMLFLAVTLGFFVENQREHYIEHQRAKVYAANLYDELRKDTATLGSTIEENIHVIGKLDSFCLLATEKEKHHTTTGMLYYYSCYIPWVNYFSSNNTTIEQLKGSGNLRIMANEISQKLSEYGRRISDLNIDYMLSRAELEKIESLYFKIFDGYIARLISPKSVDEINRDSIFILNPPLINDDPHLMKEFIGWLKYEAHIYDVQNRRFHIRLKQHATELLSLLKKEYHLKE